MIGGARDEQSSDGQGDGQDVGQSGGARQRVERVGRAVQRWAERSRRLWRERPRPLQGVGGRWPALRALRDFLATESASSILLVGGAVLALLWANSPWSGGYDSLWSHSMSIGSGDFGIQLDLRHWVNDGLMVLFFLVIGLEIKRELTIGHLSGKRAAIVPFAAALGGMVVPALIYLSIAGDEAPRGWGVPIATDIALAVGALTLAGRVVPSSLRAYLLGLAVIDDIGAILVIALFYSSGIGIWWLLVAIAAVASVPFMQRKGVDQLAAYVAVGVVLWYLLLQSGVHPTLAGVAMGVLAPVRVIDQLEFRLHPWTGFVVVPLFALANAGIEISGRTLSDAIGAPIMWAVFLGLVVGKPLGVFMATRYAVQSGFGTAPAGTNRRHLLGAGTAAGIGFTVALFVAELAFEYPKQVEAAKMAILLASIVSGGLSYWLLRHRGPVVSADVTTERIAVAPAASE